ncbi:DUF6328 family protein [Actinoallomurus sp. CA-142502]|uniref:DUF6328 family protein n=1 Tax=Actinoallomurus sp. CA-142502 TaxID=3239885 RepID=UPI003D8DE538
MTAVQDETRAAASAGETDDMASWPECPGCRHARSDVMTPTLRRADRSFAEILQEVRVAQTGVQLLVGFLLTAPFAPEFAVHTAADRVLYVTSLIAGVATSGLLIAPAAFHRLVYGHRMKRELVQAANRLTQVAMGFMLISMVSALTLVFVAVTGNWAAGAITAGIVAWFVGCWYVMPFINLNRCR